MSQGWSGTQWASLSTMIDDIVHGNHMDLMGIDKKNMQYFRRENTQCRPLDLMCDRSDLLTQDMSHDQITKKWSNSSGSNNI